MLYGRDKETSVIDDLLARAHQGGSGALVIRGEPGIGKTALLDHAAGQAGDLHVMRRAGVSSETELAFAGLHLLLLPVLHRTAKLPPPQRRALEAALGLSDAPAADPLLVGLAVLSLLAEVAEDGPVLCLIDDAHWLDRSSLQALVFAARRLDAEGLVLIMATRGEHPAGLPELRLGGLSSAAAGALLNEAGLTPGQRYRVLAEAQGNPLALIELSAALRKGVHRPGSPPLSDHLRETFHSQVDSMPEATQKLLVIAAAEEGLQEVLAAAGAFRAGVADLLPAESAGLVTLDGQRVVFRHPLLREAVYQRAPLSLRLSVHAALAETLTGGHREDRRAWHLAASATGPDAYVAAELERTGARAARRRGHAVAAGAYQRAAALTADDAGTRARRLTLAAESATEAGDLDWAAELAAEADGHAPADPLLRSRIAHVRATALLWRGQYGQAHRLMMRAADLEPALLVRAFQTAWYVGEPELTDVAARLDAASLTGPVADLARLESAVLARLTGTGSSTGTGSGSGEAPGRCPSFEKVVAQAEESLAGQAPGLAAMACGAPLIVGAEAVTLRLAHSLVARCHAEGSVGVLPMVLFFLAQAELFHHGRPDDVAGTASTALRVAEDTGQHQWAIMHKSLLAYLAALTGQEERCRELTAQVLAGPAVPMPGAHWADWARALLDLGQGRAEAALTRLETLTQGAGWYHVSAMRCVPDLVEAAVRHGEPGRAANAVARFARLGQRHLIERCRALLAGDADAERHYLSALAEPASPLERARTALLYGEWLRRARRRSAAVTQLREAMETFERLGARPWADRAGVELRAAGARSADAPAPGMPADLTPQERHIVRLAARGLSNKDIAAQLFLSPRTVGYHLYKAYPKLGVTSRAELATSGLLGEPGGRTAVPAG